MNASLFIKSLSAGRVGAYCIRPTKRHQRWQKMSCFRPLRGRLWGVFNTPLQPGTGGPSKNCPIFVPYGAAYEAYSIRPYDWVCAILRNTDAIPQPGTCCPSKNCPVFVPFGAACGAYSIRPYSRVRAALQKNCPVFVPFGASCGAYAIRPYGRYGLSFEIQI